MSNAGDQLELSYDRKVTPLIRRQGSKDSPTIGNSFGVSAGLSCPGLTPFCESCYAAKTEAHFASAARLVRRNLDKLQACGDDVDAMSALLVGMLDKWHAQVVKRNARKIFRIHWTGDYFSVAYAEAWRDAMAQFPDVTFWAYTRSFRAPVNVVPTLAAVPNLTLYLSVDEYNVSDAQAVAAQYPSLKLASCADTQDDAAILLDKLDATGPKCPENVGRLPMVVALDGRRSTPIAVGDDAQGACAACMLCPNGTANVRFSVRKG